MRTLLAMLNPDLPHEIWVVLKPNEKRNSVFSLVYDIDYEGLVDFGARGILTGADLAGVFKTQRAAEAYAKRLLGHP